MFGRGLRWITIKLISRPGRFNVCLYGLNIVCVSGGSSRKWNCYAKYVHMGRLCCCLMPARRVCWSLPLVYIVVNISEKLSRQYKSPLYCIFVTIVLSSIITCRVRVVGSNYFHFGDALLDKKVISQKNRTHFILWPTRSTLARHLWAGSIIALESKVLIAFVSS